MSAPRRKSRPAGNRAASSQQPGGGLDAVSLGQGSLLDAEGRKLADVGANLAVNSVHVAWRVAAEAALERLAASGQTFTAEDVREEVGVLTGRENALGGVIRRAAQAGRIVTVGYRPAARPGAHARVLRVWRGVA